MQNLLTTHFSKICFAVLASATLAACSSGTGRSFLEDEKSNMRASIARSIGTTQKEVDQAFNTSAAVQDEAAKAVVSRMVLRDGQSDDKAMRAYLQDMATRFLATTSRQPGTIKVVLLESSTANAFTPGAGTVIINEGLLTFADNEAQVAAVVAHEVAHIIAKHPLRQKRISLASKAGGKFLDNYTPESLKENVGNMLRIGGNVTMNGMLRQQEMMADSFAIDMMVRVGYDPYQFVALLRNLRAHMNEKNRTINAVYGNHPLTSDREQAAIDKIKRLYNNASGVTSSVAFNRLQAPYHARRSKRLAQR
jgi:predicted Zn-dependent protease